MKQLDNANLTKINYDVAWSAYVELDALSDLAISTLLAKDKEIEALKSLVASKDKSLDVFRSALNTSDLVNKRLSSDLKKAQKRNRQTLIFSGVAVGALVVGLILK